MTQYRKGGPTGRVPAPRPDDDRGRGARRGRRAQLRVAETEKYAHVTYFFNGGREAEWNGEERRLIDSPLDIPTYDLKPGTSADAADDAFCERLAGADTLPPRDPQLREPGHGGPYRGRSPPTTRPSRRSTRALPAWSPGSRRRGGAS